MPLRAARIKISNIAGVEFVEFKPGSMTLVSGANETGKSSVFRAIKAIAEGGHDATLQRAGTDTGEVVIEFAGDGQSLMASRKYSGNGSALKVVQDGEPVSSPQSFIKKSWDPMSANPIEFLRADQKTRVKILLEAMPIEIPVDELREILGPDWQPSEAAAFEQIEKLGTQIYSRRTEKGRELKESRATVEKLSRDLPAEDSENYEEQVRVAVSRKQQIEHEHRSELDDARAEYEAAVEKINETFQPLKEEKSAEIARLEELNRQAHHVKGMTKTVDELRQGVKETQAVVDGLSQQLERLKFLRENLIKELPIKGVDVIAGEIHVGGVEWKSLSESQRMRIAIQVARHRAGEIPLICVDGAEAFDRKNFEAFTKMIEKAGLQAITFRVTDSERLKIETDGQLQLSGVETSA